MKHATITWQDVVFAHRAVRAGEYRSEQEIFEREAEVLNSRLTPTLPVPKFDEAIPVGIRIRQLKRAIESTKTYTRVRSMRQLEEIERQAQECQHEKLTQETVARKLSGYDDATWSRLREDRKRTYRRAADTLILQWTEFKSLIEVKS